MSHNLLLKESSVLRACCVEIEWIASVGFLSLPSMNEIKFHGCASSETAAPSETAAHDFSLELE